MFSKVLILALAAVANCQYISSGLGAVGGLPVYRSSALYGGGLYAANGFGYGANLGKVAGLGALRTSGAIIGGGALGYGTGAVLAGAPAISTYKSIGLAAPAVSVAAAPAIGFAAPAIARGLSVHQAGPVNAAIQTVSRTVDYTPVPYTGEPAVVQDIDVAPQESPLRINFQSKSSPLQVTQQHIPAEPGQVQVTQSEDEPQTAVHKVTRPVVQHVQEIVQPYRTLTQTVEPVIEQTHTNIHQGEGVRLTGLQSGVVGGTGVLAASGLGIAAPAVASYGVAAPAIASYGVARPAIGLATGYTKAVGLNTGLYGARVAGYGYGSGLYGAGLYGSGLYGSGYRSYGGLGGLALNGLSGLSTYGTTYGTGYGLGAAKVARVL